METSIGIHCIRYPEVAAALEAHRRNWFTALVKPARHRLASQRKRARYAPTPQWVPATA